MTTHVLILCTHNSARSVLSEGMLNHLAAKHGQDVRAHSAGSAPSGRINPFAIEALQNAGVDTSSYRSKSWDEFSRDGAPPRSIVITVCDSAAAEQCPVFLETATATGSCGTSSCSSPAREPEPVVAAAAGCCGGPAKADASACCALDEAKKSAGKAGCGCSDAKPKVPAAQATTSCCG
jgi:protein-tyrosine-phosphatase